MDIINNITGKFDSWEILSETLATKRTDKSFFFNHGSGIPRGIKWFFDVENLEKGKRLDITLIYNGQSYPAYVSIETTLGRARIFWYRDLIQEFAKYYSVYSNYPLCFFNKLDSTTYQIELINDNKDVITQKKEQEHAKTLSNDALEKIAKERSKKHPQTKETKSISIYRDPYISELAKRRANGICQLCKNPAPFNNKKSEPYLETHHIIIWLSQGGSDSIDNVTALCPNCHRKMHIVNDINDINELKKTTFL